MIATTDTTLALDLSSVLWHDVLATGAYDSQDKMTAVDADILLPYFFDQAEELRSSLDWLLPFPQINNPALDALAQAGWEADDRNIFDRLHMRTLSDVTDITLSDRSYNVSVASGNNTHVDVYVGTDSAEQITGTSGNDLLFSAGGDDTITTTGGRDVISAGDGSDTIIDEINVNTSKSPDPSQTEHDDIFIGGKVEQGLLASFHEWLRSFVDTDVVEYSNESPTTPGGYYTQGVEVTDISLEQFLQSQAVAISLRNLNNGIEETDLLVGIDKVVLTDRRDSLRISDAMLAAPILIDMGAARAGETFGTTDYDKLSYEGLSHGIVTVNGATQTGSPNPSLSGTSYVSILTDMLGSVLGIPAPAGALVNAFETNDPLHVTGAEDITLTNFDDTLWYGDVSSVAGAVTGWPSGDDYPHFGKIDAAGGNDVVIVKNADYIFADDPIDAGDPNSAVAAQDLYLEVQGGTGDDRIMIIGGTGAVAVGGLGRDFIFNTSDHGQLYGDTIDGQGASSSGQTDSDVFWYWPGTFIMDAQPNDLLQMFGIPLLGGSNSIAGVAAGDGSLAIDWFLPFVYYGYTEGNQLLVINTLFQALGIGPEGLAGVMVVEDYDFGGWKDAAWGEPAPGDLGITFRIYGGEGAKEISLWNAVWGSLFTYLDVVENLTKAIRWLPVDDPLILDLDGDGIETVSELQSAVHFDMDGDFFAEKTGWVGADDGFLVVDQNGNGRIDDVSEMFGGPDASGFAELASFDSNGDGVVDAADAGFADLKVWRDLDQDGVTDAGELSSLQDLGIVSLDVASEALGATTPQGTLLREKGSYTRADGSHGNVYEATFETDPTDTVYRGEKGVVAWLEDVKLPDAKGFGSMVNLAVAASNDFDLADTVMAAAASMTVADLKDIRDKATPVFGAWAESLDLTRELTPVLVQHGPDGTTLVDRGIYVEDADGGYWTLKSGAAILDAAGDTVARPTLEDVLVQAAAQGQDWQLEQAFSPTSRSEPLEHRDAAPYLVEIVDGRAVVSDYGVEDPDGSWRLASGNAVTDSAGNVIAQPGVADILAMTAPEGQEWRVESLGANPYADLPVDEIGVYLIDGVVVDYTVQVTDADGSFYVWARNLDRALELQDKLGHPGEYQLRNYEVDFDTLDEVGSTDDSAYRVEVMTAGQLHFASSIFGVDFQPQMMEAVTDPVTGMLSYSVGSFNGEEAPATNLDGSYNSSIGTTIELFDVLMQNYIEVSRGFAVRMALQGGLSDFARGLGYDANTDEFVPTTDRELAPMFEAIFEGAPAGSEAAHDYLANWREILEVVYPDYHLDASVNGVTGTMKLDHEFVFQMLIPAFENVGIDADLPSVLDALGVDETRLVAETGQAVQTGTNGADYLYISADGDQSYQGGVGSDTYFVGAGFGHDVIDDREGPMFGIGPDQLRFAQVRSTDVYATADGQDLVISIVGTDDVLRIKDQFLGDKIDPLFGFNFAPDTGVTNIVFADGVIWDAFQIALAVSHPAETDDLVLGTESKDVLQGGKGNDILRGGRDGDIYIFREGDGHDVVTDSNDWPTDDPDVKMDMIQFVGEISPDIIRFHRSGESDDVSLTMLDADGNETGDSLTIYGQFDWMDLPFIGLIFADEIERIAFQDGSFMSAHDVMARVLQDMKTDGEDVIYGFNNNDTLDGGAGDDLLVGRALDDTYIYGRDYGSDVIADGADDLLGSSYDVLKFTDGLRWTDFEFERDGASATITMRVKGADDAVILQDQYKAIEWFGFANMVERLDFADGTSWDYVKLAQHVIDLARTDGDDVIYGFDIANTHAGGAGNDRLEGFGGSDTYVFARGYGHDVVYDTASDGAGDTLQMQGIAFDDVIIGRNGTDLIFTVRNTGETLTLSDQYFRNNAQGHAVETFVFSDRTVDFRDLNPEDVDVVGTAAAETLRGSNFAEVLDGRAGNDTLIGGSDGDTYLFDVGYGNDVIEDKQIALTWSGRGGKTEIETDDTVRFGDDVTIENAVFTKDGDDLLISITDRTDTLRIRNQFRSIEDGIEWFEFQDGTRWHISDIEERLAIVGGSRGDDVIEGILDQPNVLDGRQGDDQLIGGRQGDTYAFGGAYDLDEIVERTDGATGAIDRVIFGVTVDPETILVRRDGDNLIIDLGNGEDRLTIVEGLTIRQVERFEFADGTTLTLDDIRSRMLIGTDGDDVLVGFDDRNDTLAGGKGSDALEGGDGNDTYRFDLGDGDDSILDSGGVDQIVFGSGIGSAMVEFADENGDLLIRLKGTSDTLVVYGGAAASGIASQRIEKFVFEDGTQLDMESVLRSLIADQQTPGHDIIDTDVDIPLAVEPGPGDDSVTVARNVDFVFNAGDGSDIVRAEEAGARIVFTDLSSSDAEIRRVDLDGSDLVIAFPNSGDQVRIVSAMSSSAVPMVVFADGVQWDRTELIKQAILAQSTERSDVITGSGRADTIDAGAGNDDVDGGGGNDTYLFNRGDGQDVIADHASSLGDRVEIRGYTPDEVTVSKPVAERDELVLTFEGTSDEIVLRFDGSQGVDSVAFGDGTIWTRDQMLSAAVGQGTPYDDVIVGTDGPDVIAGGPGNDTLSGLNDDDTYIYARGDGRDIIDDGATRWSSSESGNRLIIRDYVPGDVTVGRYDDRPDDMILSFGNGDELVIVNGFSTGWSDGIPEIEWQNGEVWTVADALFALQNQRDSGRDETVNGTDGDDTLAGGRGDDHLIGGSGDDTYVFVRGDGHDIVEDYNSLGYYTDTLDIRGYNIDDATFLLSPRDNADVLIRFEGTDDEITIVAGIGGSYNWIESFKFADGALNYGDVFAAIQQQQATDGDDYITVLADIGENSTGGLGNDYIVGTSGYDDYVFARGDGQDVILDDGYDYSTLRIEGYLPGDVLLSLDQSDPGSLIISFADSDDRIKLDATGSEEENFVVFRFDNGVTWHEDDIIAHIQSPSFGPGNDEFTLTAQVDVVRPGTGDDVYDTGLGKENVAHDIIEFGRGDGQDTVLDAHTDWSYESDTLRLIDLNPADIVVLGSTFDDDSVTVKVLDTSDQIRFEEGLETLGSIEFADGTVWDVPAISSAIQERPTASGGTAAVEGTSYSDFYYSTPANEDYTDWGGDDTYSYQIGDGHDRIDDDWTSSASVGDDDAIEFVDIASTDIVARHDPLDTDNLLITFTDHDGSITVQDFFYYWNDYYRIERFVFADGVTLTDDDLEQRAIDFQMRATEYADTIIGGDLDDVIDALGGGDSVDAGDGNDTITGGLGNDQLDGGVGSDTYVFSRGDGNDSILNELWNLDSELPPNTDMLEIHGYQLDELHFTRSFNDQFSATITFDGTSDSIFFHAFPPDGAHPWAAIAAGIALDDGTVLTINDVAALIEDPLPNPVDERYGTAADDNFTNDPTDTYYEDEAGSDTFSYARGDGRDIIYDSGAAAGEVDRLVFSDLNSTDFTDLRDIGAGDYLFTYGESTPGAGGGGNLLVWVADEGPIFDPETGNEISAQGIDEIQFADGTIWTLSDVLEHLSEAPDDQDDEGDDAGTPGNDNYQGSYGDDIIELGQGDDIAFGNGGADRFIYNRGDGNDIYYKYSYDDSETGTIVLHGITPDDLSVSRRFENLVLSIGAHEADGSDAGSIVLVSAAQDSDAWRGLTVEFDDGTVWSAAELASGLLDAYQTPGDDSLIGLPGADLFNPGAGNDLVNGVAGADILQYARGDGHDIIALQDGGGSFALELSGVDANAITILRHDSDLLISIAESTPGAGDGGSLRFLGGYDPYGYDPMALSSITFDDGTIWDQTAIAASWLADHTTAGDDHIANAGPALTYELGHGDDYVETGIVGDTYVYRNGDGHDTIVENGSIAYADDGGGGGVPEVGLMATEADTGPDTLNFADLQPDQVSFHRFGDDLLATIEEDAESGTTAGSVKITGAFTPDQYGTDTNVELIRFADGTELSVRDIIDSVVSSQSTAGDDTILGSGFDDLLIGGAGNDTLSGQEGPDTYVYQRGDGNDLIVDPDGFDEYGDGTDAELRLEGIARETVHFRSIYDGVQIDIDESAAGAGDGGSIVIAGLFTSYDEGIARVVFDDGSVIDADEIRALILQSTASPFDDIIHGDSSDTTFEGQGGNDYLIDDGGNDTYVYSRGDGNDVIVDDGYAGNDTLVLHGISSADVIVRAGVADDLELLIGESAEGAGDGGRIIVRGSFTPDNYTYSGVSQVVFDDGTTWTRDMFQGLAIRNLATDGDDQLTGTAAADRLEGLAGDDQISGLGGDDTYVFTRGDGHDVVRDAGSGLDTIEIAGYAAEEISFTRRGRDGHDLIIRLGRDGDVITVVNGLDNNSADAIERVVLTDSGRVFDWNEIESSLLLGNPGPDSDQIIGTGADDTIRGGGGADLLIGLGGNDRYHYTAGDGDDRISDNATSADDRLVLDDIASTDVVWARRSPADGDDLVLRFTGPQDRVTLTDSLSGAGNGIEKIAFSDGVEWDLAAMRAAVLRSAGTSGNDTIRGFDGADLLVGGAGDDLLIGGQGNDTYRFAQGDAHDIIEDGGTSQSDRLEITNLLSLEASVERLYKNSDTIVISFASSDDTITVRGALSESGEGIEQIAFADGVVWNRDTILDLLDNRAPVAVEDGIFTVKMEQELRIDPSTLLRNDYDADGDTLRIISVDGGEHGTAQIGANGEIIFTGADGFTGATTFTYTLSDGRNALSTTTVDVRVTPPASANDDFGFTVAEDGFVAIDVLRLLSNDVDGDRMIVSQVLDATHGTVSLSSDGQIGFTPDQDFNGLASFRYVANTPEGGRAEAVVYVDVAPVNDAPVAHDDVGFNTDEDVAFQIPVWQILPNDTDIDGDALTITGVVGNENVHVELTDDGYVIVTPAPFFFGEATFDYVVSDPDGATDTGTVTIEVAPVNDPPEPVADSLSTNEDEPILVAAADLLANDIEHDGDPLHIAAVRGGSGGSVSLLENQTVLFTPWSNFAGDAYFFYTVDDGQGGLVEARVGVQVAPVNDAPTAHNDSYEGTEDFPLVIQTADLLGNDSDVEGLNLTIQSVSSAQNGTVELRADGTVVFIPDANYWGEASFHYVVADAGGLVDDATVTLYFDPVGDAPPEAGNDTVYVYEDVPTIIPLSSLLANDTDIDRDPLEIISAAMGFNMQGSIAFNENGDIVFTPDLNSTGQSEFTYVVTDNADGTDTATVTIVMIPVNDAPTAAPDVGATTLDAPLVLRISDLMANDSDVDLRPEDYDLLSFVGVRSTSAGTVSIYNDEFIVVEYDRGFSGAATMDYTIEDEEGVEDDGTVHATIGDTHAGTLTGSAIRDLIIGTYLGERIEGMAGDDDLFGREGDDTIVGGDGADRIDGGDGFDTVDYTASNIGVRVDLAARIGQGGHAQGDVFFSVEQVIGTTFADELDGGADSDVLKGMAGSDLLVGREGDDRLEGGEGDDRLDGGLGADHLDGGDGSDTADYFLSGAGVQVSLGAGTATGGDAEGDVLIGIENLIGSDFADILEGDGGDNTLSGGRGDDQIIGGAGDDILIGGRGSDALFGGEGRDTADYSGSAEGVTINMVNASAGDGDAAGDTFTSIELVIGSFHDDVIVGDAQDNIIRGGRGADSIDGGEGFDTADYSTADEGVIVDLASGLGSAGEAAGDTLSGIEMLVGSAYQDYLGGGAASETFEGGFGDDVLAGGAGSDNYLFGFDSGADTVHENGAASDVDRIILDTEVQIRDVSVIREGDDLVLELEHDDGLLIDTVRVTDHFVGPETGVEEVVFADGTIWNRDDINFLQRNGHFNAADDIIRFADEDVALVIEPGRLTGNDATEGTEFLTVVGVSNAVNGTVTLLEDGSVQFVGAPDFNGDAFFDYTVRDQTGRESTATVEVDVLAINDAPVAHDDGVFTGTEDTVLFISYDELFANDIDIDGDDLRVVAVGPLLDENGDPLYQYLPGGASNGNAYAGDDGIYFTPKGDHYGFAGFTYTVSDPSGETSTASVELNFIGVNDAPTPETDGATARLGQIRTIYVRDLLANDHDVEGDTISFVGIHSALNGTATLRTVMEDGVAVQVIDFDADALGNASFLYDIVDEHGAQSTGTVEIDVIPLNDPPNAYNDGGFETLEDQAIVIDPSALLANDTDPNGDSLAVIDLERFPLNGKVAFNADGMIVFTPRADYNGAAGFTYTISDGRGGTDTAFVSINILVDNDAPVLHDDVVSGLEDIPITILAAEAFANDMDPDGDVIFFEDAVFVGVLTDDFGNRTSLEETVDLATPLMDGASVAVTLADGSLLPSWLTFDEATLTFSGEAPIGSTDPIEIRLAFNDTDPTTGDPVSYEGHLSLDPNDAALPSGIAYDPDLMAVSLGAGSWSAELAAGRPLPGWLSFNPETMTIERTVVEPGADEDIARVRIEFAPTDGTEGFALEFRIDPNAPLDPAINALLANPGFFTANNLWVMPIADDAEVTAAKAGGAELPSWLSFDPDTLSFTGTPPAEYVGSIPVRIDVGASAETGMPAYSLIRDIVVDETYHLVNAGGFSISTDGEHIYVTTPEDFNGAFAIDYTAHDEKDGVSADPARIVVNVEPQRELPDPVGDVINTTEDTAVTFALADLLANDLDDDGDAIRVVSIGDPDHGTLTVDSPELTCDLPPVSGLEGSVTHGATMADGSGLPSWLSIDPATGQIIGTPPLDFLQVLDIVVHSTDGTDVVDTAVTLPVDGNAGVTLTYQPDPQYSGTVNFSYTITDDHEGTATTNVEVRVAPANDPPVAYDDSVNGLEDTVLTIDPATLTANDSDVDGDALRILSVLNAAHGTVELSGNTILFTPDHNFDGEASFDYLVTDDADGVDVGHVTVHVASTNQHPVTGIDHFTGTEDTPVIVTVDELLANDGDPDGDEITFVGIDQNGDGGQAFVLPDGSISLAPRDNITGEVTFTYTVTDGRLGSTETRNIIVDLAPVNDAPTVEGESGYVTDEDQPITIDPADLLANDSDVEGDALSITAVLDPVNGSVRIEDGQVIFTPRADYFGNGGFSYTVSDGNGGFTNGFVSITVSPESDLPVVLPDSGWTVEEDSFIDIDPADLIANDYDPDGDAITFVGASGAGIEELPNGMIRFTPAANANGHFTFTYAITDGSGPSVTGTFSIDVLPVEDGPIAVDDAVEGVEDETQTIAAGTLRANDNDVDGDAISITSVGNAVGGTVSMDQFGNIVFVPDADRSGTAAFDYVLTDITGATDTATVTIDLQPVNDAPTISMIAPLTGTEDTHFSAQLPDGAFSDVDGDDLSVTVRLASGDPLPDWLVYYPEARGLAGDPPADFAGTIELEVVASDGEAATSRIVQLVIEGVNDAPIAMDDVVEGLEDETILISAQSVLANDHDVDGDALTITSVSAGPGATAVLDENGNILVNRAPETSGDVEVHYTVSDGELTDTATIIVSVEPVNDAPTVTPIEEQHSDEDAAVDFRLPEGWASDVDGDALTITANRVGGTGLPAWLAFDPAELRFTGTPPTDFNGSISIEVKASDGELSTSSAFDLVIDPVNDAPRIVAPFSDRFVPEDQHFDISLQQGLFADTDGDALTYTLTAADGSPLPSWLIADPEHLRLAGTPPADFTGSLDIRITASDGDLTASDVFKFTVTPSNDAPVLDHPLPDIAMDDAGQPLETGTAFSIDIPADTFSDPDGDALQYAATLANGGALPSWMSFDGSKISGTAPHNAAGQWNIEILASDGSLQNSDVFSITFQQGDEGPVARDDGRFNVYTPADLTISTDVLLANDTDADNDPLAVVSVGQGAHGTVTLVNGKVTYHAADGYVGDDQFIYTVSDGASTDNATVYVKVDDSYADYEQGTSGDDSMFGGFGSGSVFGGDGNDTLTTGLLGGHAAGGAGNDRLIALLGNSTLDGNEGDDRITGGIGRDTISGGTGNDQLTGGFGNDNFIFHDGDGSDTITDFNPGTRLLRTFFIAGDEISIDVDGIDSFDDLMQAAHQADDGVLLDFGNGDELFLKGTQLAALDKDSFTFF